MKTVLGGLRTLLACLITRHLRSPHPLAIRAWFWPAAEADDLTEKRLCLKAILQVDPENETASLALLVLDGRRQTN